MSDLWVAEIVVGAAGGTEGEVCGEVVEKRSACIRVSTTGDIEKSTGEEHGFHGLEESI